MKHFRDKIFTWIRKQKGDFQICISVPLKEFQLKCEVYDLYFYTEMLINSDMLAFRFWLKCISSLFKWTIILKIKQNVH